MNVRKNKTLAFIAFHEYEVEKMNVNHPIRSVGGLLSARTST